MRIAIDAMGGDIGCPVTVAAAISAVKTYPDLSLTLVGDEAAIRDQLAHDRATALADLRTRLQVRPTTQKVEMHESPSNALRTKKDSSMRVAIDLVKIEDADACVSAGNTGALMAIARFVLKTLPGIDRPAICGTLPGINGHTHVLDLGANVDCSSDELYQFAVMGSALVSAVQNKEHPTVALLNVGEEEIKGNDRVKQTAALLGKSALNYVGFVEGDDLMKGKVDVIVCDGFVGNIALKTAEGTAKMIMHFMRQEFTRNPLRYLAALIAKPALRAVQAHIDPSEHNGASLLGLKGIVIKSHGAADVRGFLSAIKEARQEIINNVPARISERLSHHFENGAGLAEATNPLAGMC